MIDTIGDSLLNAFVKIRKSDERFVQMRERVDRLEENLNLLEKTQARTNKRTDGKYIEWSEKLLLGDSIIKGRNIEKL